MTNAFSVDVGDGSEELVGVKFDNEVGDHLFHFEILFHDFVDGVGDVVHDDVQVDLVGFVAVGIKVLPHFDAVRVVKQFQDLQLSVLVPLVLEHLLYSHHFRRLRNRRLKHHSERPIPNDLLRIVRQTLQPHSFVCYPKRIDLLF